MPSGDVDRFQQVGILAKDNRDAGRDSAPNKSLAPLLVTQSKISPVLSTTLAESTGASCESTGASCTRPATSVSGRRRVPLQALAYGHCGKKFAAKVP